MGYNKETAAIFAKCFRLIVKLSVSTDDDFFADLLIKESEGLLKYYVNFLKCEGTNVSASQVAQYNRNLFLQIKNILSFLNILKHLNSSRPIPYLILERDLLYLELLVLDSRKQSAVTGLKAVADRQLPRRTINKIIPKKLGIIHDEIASFISGKERVQNTEIFIRFVYVTRRTLKRKLSELLNAGVIKRLTLGKKVFYHGVDKNVDET